MHSDEEKEPTFEMKTWTPEVRNRKIERVRRSVQLSYFSLERIASHENPGTLPEATIGKEESKSSDFGLLIAHKKTSSADVTAAKKKNDQFKNLAKKRMLEAVQKEANFGTVKDKNVGTQDLHNLDSLKSLNYENSKNQNNEQPDLNTATDSQSDSEDDESNQSQPEDYIFSSPKKGEHRHSIFYSSSLNEAQELKEELQIEDNPDIHFIQGDFFAYYQEDEILGEGASGTVKKCTKVGTDQIFAVKIVRYRGDTERLFSDVKEFENHKRLNHRNIIKVYELYIDYINKKTYLVMELVECREMLEVIHEFGHFSERLAAKILKQVLSGINYLHLKGVCHRDLKPDNILISQDGEMAKIVDFNVSKFSKSQDYSAISNENYKMWTQTGTIAFTAPEVFNDSQYTEAIDMWSVGVILYTMLCGYQPFQADNVQELIEKIKKAEYEFHPNAWSHISPQAKDLIKCLLNIDVKKRYSPFQALTHPWIENQGNSSPIQTFGTMDNLWSYFNGNGFVRQQPFQSDNAAYGNYSGLKLMDMNVVGQNSEGQTENYNKPPVSNILLLSKLTSSFSHIEGKCLNKLPEAEGESKPKALLPKIPHFSTQGELPHVFNQFTK